MRESFMNPSKSKLIESSEIFCLTNQIHDTNLLKNVLQIESTIWIFCKKLYKLNLQYKSLRFGFASLPAWIRKDSFCAIVLRIRKDSFCAIVLRIRKDSWGFVGFVKTGRNFGSSGHESNPGFESLRIGPEILERQQRWSDDWHDGQSLEQFYIPQSDPISRIKRIFGNENK